jgi:TRAP-type C4-dicarboxylate transport system substrate-binding protein
MQLSKYTAAWAHIAARVSNAFYPAKREGRWAARRKPVSGVLFVLALCFTAPTGNAGEAALLRIATLAPEASGAGVIFKAFDKSVRERSGERLKLRLYAGGVAGDERDVIRKMKIGQLEGAALTSIGLGQIVRSVLVLQMPGLFQNHEQVDKVRSELASEFQSQFKAAGYVLLAWGDVGDRRVFGKRPMHSPADYKSARPWVWREDPISSELMNIIGANGVALGLPEVFPALQTGMVDTVTATAVTALGLQWFRFVKFMSKSTGEPVVGATVVRKPWFDALPVDAQEALREVSESFSNQLRARVRSEDERAAAVLRSRGMQEYDMMDQRAEWEPVLQKLAERMVGKLYSRELLERVYTIAHGRPPQKAPSR